MCCSRRGETLGGASSEEETEHTEADRTESGSWPSQCFVDRCSSAVCFCAHGLPLASGTGQRCDLGQLGSVHLPRAPRMQTSTPLIFLCHDLSKALAAGTWLGTEAEARFGLGLRTARLRTAARLGAFVTGLGGGGRVGSWGGFTRGLGTCTARGRG